jgi:tripartite-type tricarboxylate transporter receptor subunit TctC
MTGAALTCCLARRRTRRAVAWGLAGLVILGAAWAQAPDARPTGSPGSSEGRLLPDGRPVVRIVVPAPPGGTLDASARLFAQKLSSQTGEPHIVENRQGAGIIVGTEHVVRSAPDGRTLLFTGSGIVTNAAMVRTSFSPLEDLLPVIQLSQERYVLVASSDSGIASVRDLDRLPGGRPGGWNCGAVPGATTIGCEQLKARTGRVVTIPYGGLAPALTALQGGHVDLMFANQDAVAKAVESGRARVIAQSARGAGAAPGVPAFTEVWPGLLMEGAYGIMVPARTPAARVQQINRDFNQALADPQVAERMRQSGQEPVGGTPEHYMATLRRLHERYGELLRSLGLAVRP